MAVETRLPYLLCECPDGHQFKLALPWWSFNIRQVECEECGKPIESVQFMGQPRTPASESDNTLQPIIDGDEADQAEARERIEARLAEESEGGQQS